MASRRDLVPLFTHLVESRQTDAPSTASPEVPDIIVDIFASLVGSCEAAALALSVIDIFISDFPALVIESLLDFADGVFLLLLELLTLGD